MTECQVNFAMLCATSSLGTSWQRLNHPNLLVSSVYQFVYVNVALGSLSNYDMYTLMQE